MSLETPKPQAAAAYRIYDWRDLPARDEAAEPQRRPPLSWAWRASLAVMLAVPLLLMAFAAAQNYRLEQREAEEEVMQTVGELHEQSLKVFETYELVLAWVDDRIRGLDWNQIGHDDALHRFLADLQSLPQTRGIAIIGPDGVVRAEGDRFPAPASDVSQNAYFRDLKARHAGIVIDRVSPATAGRPPGFVIARPRAGGAGFDGIVSIVGRSEYFTEFYGTIAPVRGYTVALLRNDGEVLAGYPLRPATSDFAADSALMQAIARAPAGGTFRDSEGGRIYGYRHVKGLPLYVVFGMPTDAVFADLRGNLLSFSLFALPAALALFGLMVFAARQVQQQQVATARWRATARRLKDEFERRDAVEAELRQAQKMEVLGQLTGGVALDFNNLLTVLQGNLELLAGRQPDPGLEARVEQSLQTVDRGARLTRQLLAFARRQPLWLESVDVNGLIRGMDELLARTVGGNVSVVTELAGDLRAAEADTTQLELAIINLAINARDAMPGGGTLRIRTFNATLPALDGQAGGNFVGLEVADTGTGMTPEVQARAFEPFFTTKPPEHGTGLGLSMVYGFVRQTGGRAAITSAPGRGTTVTLHLPVAAAGAG